MVTERESLAKSVPPIDVKSLQKFCRSKLDFFDQFGEKELTASGPLWYKDNGSNVLAVLPLDVSEKARHFSTLSVSHDKRYYCPALHRRVAAYIVLDYLAKMNILVDVLLTTGEEKLDPSGLYFQIPPNKKYNWIFNFTHEGIDVGCYDYYDYSIETPLRRAGWKHVYGGYDGIVELADVLRVKGFNFGAGLYKIGTLDAHVSSRDFMYSMKRFITFFKENYNNKFTHTPKYNAWTPEDGFMFVHKRNSDAYQDTFTDAEIEVLEIMDYQGLDFGKRITPPDLRNLLKENTEVQKLANKVILEKEPSLFDNSEVNDEVTAPPERARKIKVVREMPAFYAKEAKVVRDRNPEETLVIHSEGTKLDEVEKLAKEATESGKQTVGPVISTTPDIVESGKIRVVGFIPQISIDRTDDEYKYEQNDNGKWNWRKTKTHKKVKVTEAIF
jgi:hypothetical protein